MTKTKVIDYTKQCWYCFEETMHPESTYYQCSECGATWNEQPDMSGTFLDIEPAVIEDPKHMQTRPVKRHRSTIKHG